MTVVTLDNAESLIEARDAVRRRLLARLGPEGCWQGRLSGSALATAVAVFALAQCDRETHAGLIERGLGWLAANPNEDGGWGDSPESPSNLSTTLLCWSALSLDGRPGGRFDDAVAGAEAWLVRQMGDLAPQTVASSLLARYGEDRTFSAPILTMCALAGRLGPGADAWRLVPQLPFELALLPRRVFGWLRLPVVSYAIPALVAIGLVRHCHAPAGGAIRRRLREVAAERGLCLIESIQPEDGGFLAAAPLTGFVAMSLAASGRRDHAVTGRAVGFLAGSAREDGSWPIDANLATWLTTLAVNALCPDEERPSPIAPHQAQAIRGWLLRQQFAEIHPYTLAAPGGWGWTDLPGAVPDADDTAGALLALRRLCERRTGLDPSPTAGPTDAEVREAASAGLRWLLGLQNRDGGMPTFCRGWGKLPFDRSCPDITAHALRAFAEWRGDVRPELRSRLDRAFRRGARYLSRRQRQDGSWIPLWFGNQWAPNGENPTYGTAQVLVALQALAAQGVPGLASLVEKGLTWLADAQKPDGGWGGAPGAPSSVEETGLALSALTVTGAGREDGVRRGLAWLTERAVGSVAPAPIGLYFARLWYSEELYPLIFAATALERATVRQPTDQRPVRR